MRRSLRPRSPVGSVLVVGSFVVRLVGGAGTHPLAGHGTYNKRLWIQITLVGFGLFSLIGDTSVNTASNFWGNRLSHFSSVVLIRLA